MANRDWPRGLHPAGDVRRVNVYVAGAAVARGDAVKVDSTGRVVPAATGGSAHSADLIGVAVAAASAQGEEIQVWDHPDQEFYVQADGNEVDAQTDIFLNAAVLGTDPVGGESRQELDSSSIAETATLPLKILRVSKRIGNAFGAQVELVVKINNHSLAGGTGTDTNAEA